MVFDGGLFVRGIFVHAVILAAGMGTRLGGDGPKPLTPIGKGRSLLSNQIELLVRWIPRDRIMLVLGHEATRVIEAHPDLMYVYNDRYATTNTAKSLLCAARKLDDDLLWANGDVFFEGDALQRLFETRPSDSCALVNRDRTADEEIKYTMRQDGTIDRLSKNVEDAAGESLGVQIIRREALRMFIDQLDGVGDHDYFEAALEALTMTQRLRLFPVDIGDAFCREVDFPEDLEAVRARVATRGAS